MRAVCDGSRGGNGLVVECAGNVAHADDADQAVIVDHGQMADMVSVHQVPHMFERIDRFAGNQLLHRDQLRDLQIDAGSAMLGNGAHDVAFGEHADRGVAFGPHHILDHERADIAGAHQLSRNADSLVHSNRRNAGSFLAQDVSNLHRNLRQVRTSLLAYIMPIVN